MTKLGAARGLRCAQAAVLAPVAWTIVEYGTLHMPLRRFPSCTSWVLCMNAETYQKQESCNNMKFSLMHISGQTDCTQLNFKFTWSHLTQSRVLCQKIKYDRTSLHTNVQPSWHALHKQCNGVHMCMYMPAVRLAFGHWSLQVWRLNTVLYTWL